MTQAKKPKREYDLEERTAKFGEEIYKVKLNNDYILGHWRLFRVIRSIRN